MEEDFQYTNKFLRDNKDFILSVFHRDNWEFDENWSIEQKNAATFSCYVFSVLSAINIVCRLIDNSRYSQTESEALLSSQLNTVQHHILGELTDETDKLPLLPIVIKFITPDVMDEYAKAAIGKQADNLRISPDSFGIQKFIKDNKLSLLKYESPYKYFVNYVFWHWVGNIESKPMDFNALDKIVLYRTKFDSASWFSRIENISTLGYSYEQHTEVLYGIVNDHTKLKDSECVNVFEFYLALFEFILGQFKEMDKDYIETDDRENLYGICISKEKTKEERRIEVAANYLVENHYIAENYKDLFVNIMNNRCPSGEIKFSHGVVNGKSKKKGGMNVLYGIIRFIREENFNPDVKEGKRQYIPNHSNDCWHFSFPEDPDNKTKEEKWNSIKDSGRRNSISLSRLIKNLNSKL